jgi:hypothetical protein
MSFSMIGKMPSQFRDAQTGEEFIQDDQVRPKSQTFGQFQPLEVPVGKAAR